jgi:hypothetical protein
MGKEKCFNLNNKDFSVSLCLWLNKDTIKHKTGVEHV